MQRIQFVVYSYSKDFIVLFPLNTTALHKWEAQLRDWLVISVNTVENLMRRIFVFKR